MAERPIHARTNRPSALQIIPERQRRHGYANLSRQTKCDVPRQGEHFGAEDLDHDRGAVDRRS
jgi:hypothetical protein